MYWLGDAGYGRKGLVEVDGPNAFEVGEVGLDVDATDGGAHAFRRALQLLFVVFGFGPGIAAKPALQATVSAAIGVHHENHEFCAVKADGFAKLIEDELAVAIVFRRCESFGAAGDFNRIRVHNSKPFQELAESELKAMIEAPHDGRITHIGPARRIEVEHLLHHQTFSRESSGGFNLVARFRSSYGSSCPIR